MAVQKTTKHEPPDDELEIDYRATGCGGNARKPHLTISLDCLEAILTDETAIIAPEDVNELLIILCEYARRAGHGNSDLASAMIETYKAQTDEEDDCDEDAEDLIDDEDSAERWDRLRQTKKFSPPNESSDSSPDTT